MFSVIIPVYNSSCTIQEVLDSVYSQTKRDLIEEVIVVNDGSTDNSVEIVEDYANSHKELNFIVINQTNKGVSGARNTGIKKAKAAWIALLDSDDCWIPEKLELQYDCICENKEILFLGASTDEITQSKIGFKKIDGLINANAKQICIRNFPQTSTVIFKRECINDVGLFDENMRYGEDINYYQKFLIHYDNYYYLPVKVVNYGINKRFHGDNGLSANFHQMHRARCKNTRELFEAHKITFLFYLSMQGLNQVKYMRRRLIRITNRLKIK